MTSFGQSTVPNPGKHSTSRGPERRQRCHTIELMSLLRFLSLLILVLWIGGLAALGFVGAPAIFNALEARDPEGGRAMAALVFGAIFARFNRLSWVLGALLLALLGTRAALGPRPRRLGLRMWTALTMIAMSLVAGLWLAPRIDALRAATPGPIVALPDGDATKTEFSRLHGASTALMGFTILAGAGLIWLEMKE
jgi:uncharacterized membrane protein